MPGLAGEKARSEHPATKEFPTSLEKMKADNLRFNAREDREDKGMIYQSREQAANLLSVRLSTYKGKNPLVLGIPRGGVPMASIIAEALRGELDVVLVHKLRAPGQPELAIGSIDETGSTYLSESVTTLGIGRSYIQKEREVQLEMLRRRRERYTSLYPPIDPAGRILIVVDDGIATGSTMIAALRSVRVKHPKKVVAALAVAPPESLPQMEQEADEVVCLETPGTFRAVGEFFLDFSQVSDDDVAGILKKYSKPIG